MALVPLIFSDAKSFYHSLSTEEKQRFSEECGKICDYLDELSPVNPTASTLSVYRKWELENRVSKLVEAVRLKLTPPALSSVTVLQLEALHELVGRLPLQGEDLHKAVKRLPEGLSEKVRHAVWMAIGSPKEDPQGIQALKADPGILERPFPAYYNDTVGTLLEQIRADLEIQLQLAKLKEAGNAGELERLTKIRDDQKVAVFQSHLKNLQMNHRQMKALYHAMPPSVQARLPKPPFYGRGFNPDLYRTLGAHYNSATNTTRFCVYAPHAREITLNLTAFGRIEYAIRMVKKEDGVWEAETPHAPVGRTYYFSIVGKHGGDPFKKVDPFAFGNLVFSRAPVHHESVVCDMAKEFPWTDDGLISRRSTIDPAKTPMAIYEVHAPSWKKKENSAPLHWRELAGELIHYCKWMGYTHVELMGIFEHPDPKSMGYQITNFFALNASLGSIEDFQYFVNCLHKENIGIIADWVPAHFAVDPFALGSFDGAPVFEDDDPSFAMHPQWGTYEFDFKKPFVRDFLGSNLDFLLRKFHVDGVRIDAVQSMLNLNYGRKGGARLNRKATEENLDAKAFLRNILAYVRAAYPGVMTIAEEAMGFPNLTRRPSERGVHTKTRGVGFDLTWHMGFTNHLLKYLALPLEKRSTEFGMLAGTLKGIDYNEDSRPRGKVVLPLSHDESANGKGTIFTQMGGMSFPDKFANGRLLLAYQLLRGGGPILDFMGNEFLQTQEWHGRLIQSLQNPAERGKPSVQWEELDPRVDMFNARSHIGARDCRRALLQLFHGKIGLQDQTDAGFSWINAEDALNSIMSFHRKGGGQQFACIFNFSCKDLKDYKVPLPDARYAPELSRLRDVREVYNTDSAAYAGEGRVNKTIKILRNGSLLPTHFQLRLAPYSALVLEERFS